jgi:cell division initiation protein
MPLTPIDVQQKTFGTALRGYDLDEVDDFLDDVVTSLKDYEQRLRDAQERITTLENEMTDRGDAEGAIARALVAAQRSADAIIDDAKGEADRILSSAQTEASEMSRMREDETAAAEAEIARIRAVVDVLRGTVRELSASVGDTLDRADASLSSATADLVPPEDVEVAVTEADETSSWEPSALDEIEEFDDSSDDEVELEDELVDSADSSDDDDRHDSPITPDWAMSDDLSGDDDHPVRPWEIS